jgi:hypothetical protein
MREPPRLNDGVRSDNVFSDSAGGNAGAGPSFPYSQPPMQPPPSGMWKTVALAFGGTFLLIGLLCGGMVTWVYYAFNSPAEMTAEYREFREPEGGKMQQEVIDVLNSAAPQTSPDIESLQRFLLALVRSDTEWFAELVDYPRAVEEMQASGLSVGVNALTKSTWVANLEASLSVPTLEPYHQVVDFRWLIAGKEARVTVVGFSEWNDDANVYLLYLTFKNGKWKLYDHRDPLLPLSEVGYFAAYSAAPMAISDHYYDMSVELESIYADERQSNQQRAARSLQSFKRYKYHRSIVPMAQNLTAAYLLIYRDIPSLRELTRQFTDESFAGAYRIKAELALLENDPTLAFQHVESMVANVGWHPKAALLAGRAASTVEQRQQAAEWLRRSLVLAPQHTESVAQFARVATDADYQQLLADFAEQPSPQLMALRLGEQLSDAAEISRVAALMEDAAVSDAGEFSFAAGYLRFREAQQAQEADEAEATARAEGAGEGNERLRRTLEVAGKLLEHPDLPELRSLMRQTSGSMGVPAVETKLWNALLEGMDQSATFELAVAAAPDRNELISRLRDRILMWYARTDWPKALELLQSLPADADLAMESSTIAAVGVCHYRLNDFAAAYQVLLPLITKNAEELDSPDSPPDYAEVCLMAAGKSAVELEKTLELADALQAPETAFIVVQSYLKLDKHAAEIEALNEWYSQFADAPAVWLNLYRAELSYSKGQWEEADERLAEAIQLATDDNRFVNASLPPMVSSFLPYSEDPSDWFDLRVERALDAGRFADLWKKLADLSESSRLSGALRWVWSRIDDPATLNEIAELVLTIPEPTAFAINLMARQHYEERMGNIDAALQLALEGAAAADQDTSYYHSSFPTAVRLMAVHGKFELLDRLNALATTADERAAVTVLRAMASGDAAQMLGSLEQYEDRYRLGEWFDSIDRIAGLQRAKLFEAVNARYPVSLSSLAADYAATGTLALDQPAASNLDAIEAALSKATGQPLIQLELESFPKAVAAWSCPTAAGELLAVAYDEPPIEQPLNRPTHAALDDLRSRCSDLLCLVLQQPPEQKSPTKPLRLLVADVGEQLPVAQAYFDNRSSQWFSQADWPAELRRSAAHGINRSAPIDSLLPSPYIDPQFTSSSEQMFVSIGLIVEKVAVTRETSVKDQASEQAANDSNTVIADNEVNNVNNVNENNDTTAATNAVDEWELYDDRTVHRLQRTPKLLPLLPPGTRVVE